MNITKNKLKSLIKDEQMATKEYKKLGYNNLSRDENKHALFLKSRLKKL